MKKDMNPYMAAVARLFTSDDGQTVLNQFMEEYWTVSGLETQLNPQVLAYNEGRRSVIKDFINICDETDKLKGETYV